MKHKIILDCDPGHDDAIAILLAAHHPAIDLLAITTVAGNQSVEKTAQNALKICSLAKIRHVPVAQGMERPLIRPAQYAANIHGVSGLDGPHLPDPDIELVSQHAVDLIIDLLMHSDGDVTLVPTGPLTNIATAMRREPAIIPRINAISLMGGAIGLGNTTPAAEFNIWCDPEAAAVVFGCGRPIMMVPLEVTHQALATDDVLQRLRRSGRTVAIISADLLAFFAGTYQRVFGFSSPPLHDPCAVAAVIEPDILRSHSMHVEIETTGIWTAGRTVCDVYGQWNMEANAHVGYALDVPRFWEMVISTLLTYQ
jgi:inosine-uridine nucleoside N-ribohydrolase